MFLSLALLERHPHELFQFKSNMSLEALRVDGLDRKEWFGLIEARIDFNHLVILVHTYCHFPLNFPQKTPLFHSFLQY